MHNRNGSSGPSHASGCALRLTGAEQAWLERRLEGLTTREREVVRALCEGGPNEALADRLCVALPTLRTHLMRINQKLGSESKDDIVRFVAARLIEAYRRSELLPADPRADGRAPAVLVEAKAQGAASAHDGRARDAPERGSTHARNHRYR